MRPRAGLLALLILSVAACGFAFVGDEGKFLGTSWRAVSVRGVAPVPGREPTLTFDTDLVFGSAGCNAYRSAALVVEGSSILIGGIGMDTAVCDDPKVMEVEAAFLEILEGVERIEFRNGLVLAGPLGEVVFHQIQAEH